MPSCWGPKSSWFGQVTHRNPNLHLLFQPHGRSWLASSICLSRASVHAQGEGNSSPVIPGEREVVLWAVPGRRVRGSLFYLRILLSATSPVALEMKAIEGIVLWKQSAPSGPRPKCSPSTPFMVHAFLSNNDQYDWQTRNPLFSQNSQAFINPQESIFYIYQSIWNDCQQLLATFFMLRSETGSDLRVGKPSLAKWTKAWWPYSPIFPSAYPDQNLNIDQRMESLYNFCQVLLGGLKQVLENPSFYGEWVLQRPPNSQEKLWEISLVFIP